MVNPTTLLTRFAEELRRAPGGGREGSFGARSLGLEWFLAKGELGGQVLFVDYAKIITFETGKRSGQPCIRGLRMTVYDILEYLASGMTHQEILKDFPFLTEEDLRACLAFAADHGRKVHYAVAA